MPVIPVPDVEHLEELDDDDIHTVFIVADDHLLDRPQERLDRFGDLADRCISQDALGVVDRGGRRDIREVEVGHAGSGRFGSLS